MRRAIIVGSILAVAASVACVGAKPIVRIATIEPRPQQEAHASQRPPTPLSPSLPPPPPPPPSLPPPLPPSPSPSLSPSPPPPPLPFSPPLRNTALFSPLPLGHLGGWGGDTGLDIAADHLPVYALAAGTLDYSEWGHTRWTTGKDTAFSVRIALDSPIPWGEQKITHVYYTHLSKVETTQAEGAEERKHVVGGERIGVTGIGNGTPHLHLGLLLDGQVEQDSWTYILREGDVRKVMGGYKNGERLPPIRP